MPVSATADVSVRCVRRWVTAAEGRADRVDRDRLRATIDKLRGYGTNQMRERNVEFDKHSPFTHYLFMPGVEVARQNAAFEEKQKTEPRNPTKLSRNRSIFRVA